jgi:hypothetical protein
MNKRVCQRWICWMSLKSPARMDECEIGRLTYAQLPVLRCDADCCDGDVAVHGVVPVVPVAAN